jgi:putative glutamine amidotransferase
VLRISGLGRFILSESTIETGEKGSQAGLRRIRFCSNNSDMLYAFDVSSRKDSVQVLSYDGRTENSSREMAKHRPLVGITTRHELETERFYIARYYSEAVEAAGGMPVHLPLIPKPSYIEALVGRLDGILLPGSASDVDPLLYGREPHAKLGSVHPLRDRTDLLVLKTAEERRMPLLAICFGMQVWNVFRGGTLIQDIGSEVPSALKHEQGAPRDRRSHRLTLRPDSVLGRLAGGERALVNSHHHQALDGVGRDLHATAWSTDGIIEAVEDVGDGRWAVGVQWRPEIGWEEDKFSKSLFETFLEAASSFASASDNEWSLTDISAQ